MTAQTSGLAPVQGAGPGEPLAGVWRELVGQQPAVATLRRAVAGDAHSMTHAWLVTGPPGSGRSNAAKAFAAALQCARGGCGSCTDCRTSLSGAHPDVTLVRTEMLSIGVDEVRDLVRKAAMSPTLGRWQVIVVEDADRITDRGADALLKSIEEPPVRTVWILCAPAPDDVVVTIRSRCRQLGLRTPRDEDVVSLLVERDHIDPAMAQYAARAAQGHIGRARVLARSEAARNDRHRVLQVPSRLSSLGSCLQLAAELVDQAEQEAARISGELDAKERTALEDALGMRTKGARPRNAGAALKDMEDQQKARGKRLRRDAVDRCLTELTTWYRDVLAVQCHGVDPTDLHSATGWRELGLDGRRVRVVGLINADMREEVARAARSSTPEQTVRCLDAILECRAALESNVPPLLAMESLLIQLAGLG
ncbi:DNA polymerase-3 subunit delta' [Propionibacterium cyclohexanicum]|uniref:DNA polymerase-3 subunit delta n=1 Tax=Propionibacterium cyclohexanicum TaxID=64702 RepID=A0A1H9RVQ6_9ACTN|nr:DNA polymerase III subunit delta' [Propionibacterium cyclohexanicum]SER76717.1 DNA polymerase-3 subunit delta' [Propionibacterium cyclohexanicum]